VVIGDIGQAALRVLLVVVLASLVLQILAMVKQAPALRVIGRFAMAAQFGLAALASAALVRLLVTENLWYAYVAEYTGAGLPLIYRIAAFWGGNAGSLLLWVLVLTLYGVVVAYSRHEDRERVIPVVSCILSAVTLFYTALLVFVADPFQRLPHPAAAGNDLNPLLQNPGMTVHPINVYLGYVGFTVPYAYAMACLWLKKRDDLWLRVTRRWSLVAWLFLGIGIVYGAHWSYEELGWGGYWAWDPVENASLLPWLTATAFLHSAIVQEKRGMLKGWNVILITVTFLLTLLGTFLTRSGVLWSIHAFADGPLGRFYLVFILAVSIFSVITIVWRWPVLRAEHRFEAVVSKESAFMFNNLLLLASTFAVLWGTVFPLVSEVLSGRQMVVSAPFYNAVNLPIAVCILLLMGIGPWIAWRRSTPGQVARTLVGPAALALLLSIFATSALATAYQRFTWLGGCALFAAQFVMITVVCEFYQSVKARMALTGEGIWLCIGRLIARNRRRWGGYMVHFAFAVIAVGVMGSGVYHVDKQQQLAPGGTATIGDFRVTFTGMGVREGTGTRQMYADLVVERGGKELGVLQPAATFYTNGQAPTTDIAIYSRPLADLYVVMLGTANGKEAVFDLHLNPLVEWIWWGGYLLIFGTLVSLWPESSARRSAGKAVTPPHLVGLYQDLAELEYEYRLGKLRHSEYVIAKSEISARIDTSLREAKALRQRLEAEVREQLRRFGQPREEGADGR
jgi:cytochrome c-type biogenesis protein CcmF